MDDPFRDFRVLISAPSAFSFLSQPGIPDYYRFKVHFNFRSEGLTPFLNP